MTYPSDPDPHLAAASPSLEEALLAACPRGYTAEWRAETGSTNADARIAALSGADGPTWIIAGCQTEGRGRLDRRWQSGAGNFCGSLLISARSGGDLSGLPFAVCLGIVDALVALGVESDTIACKWPNDILLGDEKVAGVLIEGEGGAEGYLIIGIGLNLLSSPSESRMPATNIKAKTGLSISVPQAFGVLAGALDQRLVHLRRNGLAGFSDEWRARAWRLGERHLINTASGTFYAMVRDLAPDGGLELTLDDGRTQYLYAGDVFPIQQSADR